MGADHRCSGQQELMESVRVGRCQARRHPTTERMANQYGRPIKDIENLADDFCVSLGPDDGVRSGRRSESREIKRYGRDTGQGLAEVFAPATPTMESKNTRAPLSVGFGKQSSVGK